MKLYSVFVCSLVLLAPTLWGQNLLTNPGCESGGAPPSGWTQVSGNWSCQAYVTPQEGSDHFFAGQSSTGELDQDIDVSAYATTIDAGDATAIFTGWIQSWPDSTPDESRVVVEAWDATKTTMLASVDSGSNASVGSWAPLQGSQVMPAGTRTIRVRLISTRNTGSDDDGYYDGLSLVVSTPNLLQNSGCESGGTPPTGWTQVSGDWTCTSSITAVPPIEGSNIFFAGSASGTVELDHEVDVSGAAASIDAGLATMDFGDYMHSYPQTPADSARAVVELLDGSGGVLTSFDSGDAASTDVWQFFNASTTITPSTRKIRVRLLSTLNNGADSDGYHDAVSLNTTALALAKSAPIGTPSAGETISYTVTATNVGSVPLTNVAVTDPSLTPSEADCATVLPGENCVLVGDHTVTGSEAIAGQIVNTANASGEAPDSSVVEAPAATVTTEVAKAVPTLDRWGMLALLVALAALALVRANRGA